jgi:hypothetical protein
VREFKTFVVKRFTTTHLAESRPRVLEAAGIFSFQNDCWATANASVFVYMTLLLELQARPESEGARREAK